MSDATKSLSDTPPAHIARELDEVCDRFETACKIGQTPRIEDYLVTLPEPDRHHLLRELIRVEINYRIQKGETPQASEYQARFPSLTLNWLTSIFARQQTA